MVAVDIKHVSKRGDGKDVMRVTLLANTPPDPLPTTGEGVTGMTSDQVFAPFSILYVTSNGAVYIADEDGAFIAQ